MNELLSFENDMLRDFIDLTERNHDLELVEAVVDCIDEEGTVSKSLEIMFGESVEDMSTFDTFCMEQYICAAEGFIKNSFNEALDDSKNDIVIDKLRKGIKRVKELIQSRGKNITYPIKLPKSDKFRTIDNLRHFMTSVTDNWHHLKYTDAYRDIEDFKNEPSPYSKDKNLNDVNDIKKFLEEIDHFIMEEGVFVKQFREFARIAKAITAHELKDFKGPRFRMTPAQIQRLASFSLRATMMFYVQSLNRIISQILSPKTDRKDDFEF